MSRKVNPRHPGAFIKMEILEPLDLSPAGASAALCVSPADLSPLLNERVPLSPEMALRLEKAFGVRMDTLLRMQTADEIAEARGHEAEIQASPHVAKDKKDAHPPFNKTE
jgi:antitoxin HigA-1